MCVWIFSIIVSDQTDDRGIDIWSVAVCLFELFAGHIMFPGGSNNEMLRLMMAIKGTACHSTSLSFLPLLYLPCLLEELSLEPVNTQQYASSPFTPLLSSRLLLSPACPPTPPYTVIVFLTLLPFLPALPWQDRYQRSKCWVTALHLNPWDLILTSITGTSCFGRLKQTLTQVRCLKSCRNAVQCSAVQCSVLSCCIYLND